MKRKVVWLVVSGLLVAALVLTSCGPAVTEEEEEEVVTEEEEEVAEEEEEEEEEGPEMVRDSLGRLVEKPRYGGVITLGFSGDISTFDELYGTGIQSRNHTTRFTHEELLTGDWAKGPAGTGEVTWDIEGYFVKDASVGLLAESWEVPDPETLIFHLRQGIHWQDKPPANGREFVANDVVQQLKLLFATPGRWIADNYPPGEGPSSITATDKYTVVFTCPPETLGYLIAIIGEYAKIVPAEAAPGSEYDQRFWENAVGTGPFLLTDRVASSSLTLERNPNYWRKHPLYPEDTMPYLDGIKFLIIPDYSTRLSAMRTGKIDYLPVGWEDAEALLSTSPELEHYRYLLTYSLNIFMHVDQPDIPQYDLRVRRALNMAVNNQEIVDEYYGGNAVVSTFPTMPTKELMGMYTPLEEQAEWVQEMYEYHPDKARALLAEAGYPDGFKTEVLLTAASADYLSLYVSYFADIGVDMTLTTKDIGAYYNLSFGKTYKDMVYAGATTSTPYSFNYFKKGALVNYSGVDDPLIETAYIESNRNAVINDPKAIAVLKDIFVYVTEQVISIELPTPYSYRFWQPWVKDYHGENSVGFFNYYNFPNYVWMDQDMKEEMTGTR
jgi:peptide/nickel transport system substrate-binding protein